ncbi:MAG: hydroxyacyl-ACP dehydratase HTD2-like protein with hotdog domain [Verrucomicrobiales bacterium]|jgi:hydroxyacyl-ACP dehydratase HTD2-like protein with hotdog domain
MKIVVGTEIPTQERTPDAIDLFTFSASAWLLHRIHYDLPFTTEHDGHPGLLVHGPLQGTYMIQAVQWWLGSTAEMKNISYRHSSPAYLGDSLTCGGTVTEIDEEAGTFSAELWVKKISHAEENTGDEIVTTSGVATFRLPTS